MPTKCWWPGSGLDFFLLQASFSVPGLVSALQIGTKESQSGQTDCPAQGGVWRRFSIPPPFLLKTPIPCDWGRRMNDGPFALFWRMELNTCSHPQHISEAHGFLHCDMSYSICASNEYSVNSDVVWSLCKWKWVLSRQVKGKIPESFTHHRATISSTLNQLQFTGFFGGRHEFYMHFKFALWMRVHTEIWSAVVIEELDVRMSTHKNINSLLSIKGIKCTLWARGAQMLGWAFPTWHGTRAI